MVANVASSTSQFPSSRFLLLLLLLFLFTHRWLIILVRTLQYVMEEGPSVWRGVPGLYLHTSWELKVFQTMAFMEVCPSHY